MDSTEDYFYLHMQEDRCWKSPDSCTNGLTICMWLNIVGPNLADPSENGGIISTVANFMVQGFALSYKNTYQLQLYFATSNTTYEILEFQNGLGWWHYCVVYMPPNTLNTYINGTLSTAFSSPHSIPKPIGYNDIVIGDASTISSNNKGHIIVGDLIIYEKFLNDNDISDLYESYTII